MKNFVILKPVEPPRVCYLWEAIQWRAFGTFPIGYWDYDGKDVREFPEDAEYFSPLIPDDNRSLTYLTENQTAMAGLSPDPSNTAAENDRFYSELHHYDRMIDALSKPNNKEPGIRAEIVDAVFAYRQERAEAVEFFNKYKKWRQTHDAYVDQFQTELLIALRRGDLVANGRKLPHRHQSRCIKIFESQGIGTHDLESIPIASDCWVSKYVDWIECSLKTPDDYFVWITITVDDMLRVFPPSKLISEKQFIFTGAGYAITENAVSFEKPHEPSRRGRPPLPWHDFYVEVARHYRDGTMPDKKEAAIQLFLDWFKTSKGLELSRSSVGEKLKPFFDALKTKKNPDR